MQCPCPASAAHFLERALFHAMKSPDPKQDGSMVAAIEFGATGHAGNDCPKDSKRRSQSVYKLEGPEVPTSSRTS